MESNVVRERQAERAQALGRIAEARQDGRIHDVRRELARLSGPPPSPELKRDLARFGAIVGDGPMASVLHEPTLGLRALVALGAVMFTAGFRDVPATMGDLVSYQKAMLAIRGAEYHAKNEAACLIRDNSKTLLDIQVLIWAGLWFRVGCPRVRLSSRQAAAFALSDVPDIEHCQVAAPWGGFMVDVPVGVLPYTSSDGEARSVDRIMVAVVTDDASDKDRFGVPSFSIIVGEQTLSGPIAAWLAADANDPRVVELRENWSITTRGDIGADKARLMVCAARIVMGTIFALDEEHQGKAPGGKHGPPKRVGGPPTTTDYTLAADVQVDFTEPLREYVLGHRDVARKSQWVVRGHWRNQACGEGLSARRRTWIRPFWKGPAHLPIRVRAHALPSEPSEPKGSVR